MVWCVSKRRNWVIFAKYFKSWKIYLQAVPVKDKEFKNETEIKITIFGSFGAGVLIYKKEINYKLFFEKVNCNYKFCSVMLPDPCLVPRPGRSTWLDELLNGLLIHKA